MTLPRLASLQDYWRSCPPLHIMVRAFLGYESKPKGDDLSELVGLVGKEGSGIARG